MNDQWKLCRIGKQYHFSSAHRLPKVSEHHPCYQLHGHNYVAEIEIRGEISPRTGFCNSIDFFEVDSHMKSIIETLDHHYLNEIEGLDNPTAENIATWILDKLNNKLAMYFSVTVWETPKCWAKVINGTGWYQKDHRD